jgi:hypothetical protein
MLSHISHLNAWNKPKQKTQALLSIILNQVHMDMNTITGGNALSKMESTQQHENLKFLWI